jgi:hypothetical protein
MIAFRSHAAPERRITPLIAKTLFPGEGNSLYARADPS